MGKNSGKSKNFVGDKSVDSNSRLSKPIENSPRAYDKDTEVFIAMSQELKDEGNRLFQKRDYEGAMLKYEKAIKLLPRNHIDVSYLRSNMAACYMQLGISEYPRAIHECNLALEVTPKYSKALLKRARCYEALNRLDLALRDVGTVLKMEPNNLMAIEIADRVQKSIEKLGSRVNEIPMDVVPLPEYIESPSLPQTMVPKEKARNKKSKDVEEKFNGKIGENKDDGTGEVKEMEEKKKERKENDEVLGRKSEDQIEKKKAEEKTVIENKDKRAGNVKENKEKAKEKKANDEVPIGKSKAQIEEKTDEDKLVENKDKRAENVKENIKERKADNKVVIRNLEDRIEEKKTEDKLVVEEERVIKDVQEEPKRTVKLVFGEDIRWAQIPLNCNVLKLREIISDRFPNSKSVLVKYRDQEGDLITITTTEELRWAESSADHSSIKLFIVEVHPNQDPFFQGKLDTKHVTENGHVGKQKEVCSESTCISDWIIQFSQLLKNYVGVDIDAYIDLHEVGTKLYSEAIEEVVTSEEAQDLFNTAAEKFQEMAALALFNLGNVHMSRARKRVYFSEDSSRESVLAEVKCAYDWARNEYMRAGKRYEEALKIKPNFYEAVLALGQQQFEQAKLSWYYAVGTNVDLESWPSTDVLQLYNSAEENMEKGMQMWEESEAYCVNEVSKLDKVETLLQKMKLDDLFKSMSADEAKEQAANIRCQIYILWGTILYERSIMEFKLGFPVWQECLEVAVEKFELAGASPTDIAVMIKNHYSNKTALEAIGFNIDEIVQAWSEMYEAKRLKSGIPSHRLEPLIRRRVSKFYHALEHA